MDCIGNLPAVEKLNGAILDVLSIWSPAPARHRQLTAELSKSDVTNPPRDARSVISVIDGGPSRLLPSIVPLFLSYRLLQRLYQRHQSVNCYFSQAKIGNNQELTSKRTCVHNMAGIECNVASLDQLKIS